MIDELYRKYTGIDGSEATSPDIAGKVVAANHPSSSKGSRGKEYGICKISKLITDQITAAGYTGSERTVRNYLSSRFISVQPDTCRKDDR